MPKKQVSCVKKAGRNEVSSEVVRVIGKCRRLWSTYTNRGLEVRYEMGVLLNEMLGDPAERQAHGAKVLKRAASELQISRSELTRMKQFAAGFSSFAVFREKHPDCGTWSAVKAMRSAPTTNPDGRRAKAAAKSAVSGLVVYLSRFNNKLRATELRGDEGEMEQLRATLNELIELAQSRLGQGLQSAQV